MSKGQKRWLRKLRNKEMNAMRHVSNEERRVNRFIESSEGQYLRKYCLKEYYDTIQSIRNKQYY